MANAARDPGIPLSTPDPSSTLSPTAMLDFNHPGIQALIARRGWQALPAFDAIGAVYDFVRNDIRFGYNRDDTLAASEVLAEGYGQCNTKSTLLMALLRALGHPTRLHGFTIDNRLQRGAIPGYLMPIAPARILHSWVEVYYQGRWLHLEGVILDQPYLAQIQRRFTDVGRGFCGYGVATADLSAADVAWRGEHTYIQKQGIADDFGHYPDPDSFYARHGSNLQGLRKWLYSYLFRHLINRQVEAIRQGRIKGGPSCRPK